MTATMVVSIYRKDEVAIFDVADTTPVSGYHQQAIDNVLVQDVCREIQRIAGSIMPSDMPGLDPSDASPCRVDPECLAEFARLGRIVYTQCLPGNVRQALERSTSRNLVLRVDSNLMDIPWEIAFDGRHALSMRFCTSRQILVANPSAGLTRVAAESVSYPIKVLIIADPSGTLSSADQEVEVLMDLLDNMSKFQVEVVGGSRASRLNILKLIESYDIVHFAGHSDTDPNRPDQRGWRLTDGFLCASDFAGLNKPPMLVFSNSCASAAAGSRHDDMVATIGDPGLGGGFLLAGVPHFIGALWVIHDAASAVFAKCVYHEMLKGNPIGEACLTARQVCMQQYPELMPVWSAYVHFGDPSDVLMPVALAPEPTFPVSDPPPSGLFKAVIRSITIFCMLAVVGLGGYLWHLNRQPSSGPNPAPISRPVVDARDAQYEKAVSDYRNLRIDDAITGLVRLTGNPDNTAGRGLALLSDIYREAGLQHQAETCLKTALEKNPSDPLAFVLKGDIAWADGDGAGAETYFRQAAESPYGNPCDRSQAWNRLGVLAFLTGNSQDAVPFFETAVRTCPTEADAIFNLAFSSYLHNDIPTAVQYLDAVLKDTPNDAAALSLQLMMNVSMPVSGSGGNSASPPDLLVIPPFMTQGHLDRLGMDAILAEKLVMLLTQQFPQKRIQARPPLYGRDYPGWVKIAADKGSPTWLESGVLTENANEVMWGEFGQTAHTLTLSLRWVKPDSGRTIFDRTFFGNDPDKLNGLMNDLELAFNNALSR